MKKFSGNLLLFGPLGLALLWAVVPGTEGQETPISRFPHLLHIEDVGMECETCHQQVAGSKIVADNLIPEKEGCLDCHDDDIYTKYRSYVVGARAIERILAYCDKFNHSVHVEKEIRCLRCHPGIGFPDSASTEYRPRMATCVACHDLKHVTKGCIICHESERGKLPKDHILPLWRIQHGDDARADNGAACYICHERDNCQECHQGDNLLPRAHMLGFEFKHALEIRTGRTECAACHEDRAFCIECHRERHVYPRSHQRASWANTIPGSGGRHGIQALINIEACAACHTDEPDNDPVCTECHGN